MFNDSIISEEDFEQSFLAFADSFTPFDLSLHNMNFKAEDASKENPIYRNRDPLNQGDKSYGVYAQEICHIFSTVPFFGDFPQKTLGIHIDGGASYSNRSAWLLNDPTNDESIQYLTSDWKLHDDVNNFSTNALTQIILGIYGKPGADLTAPGKLMGLAAYGHGSTRSPRLVRTKLMVCEYYATSFFRCMPNSLRKYSKSTVSNRSLFGRYC